ncbi:MAG: nucleotide exchange factor GrpE [Gammaproteobacteria bacterium]|nr:nucleotide exchange factor GrpE [Gammaproteobacteria bacterium]
MSKPDSEKASEAKAKEENESEENRQDITADEEFSADEEASEKPDSLEEALAKLAEAELVAEKAGNDLLRVQAEMQNLRRRTEQDVERAHKYGQEKFSAELLLVMDNLERALDSASQHDDEAVKAICDGVNLTLKSFMDCFAKFNIEVIDPIGEPFDPQLHQAMSIQENPEAEPNTVIAVMQKGYTLHGRVLRPAMVMVSKE